jgi:hypothetical protein
MKPRLPACERRKPANVARSSRGRTGAGRISGGTRFASGPILDRPVVRPRGRRELIRILDPQQLFSVRRVFLYGDRKNLRKA